MRKAKRKTSIMNPEARIIPFDYNQFEETQPCTIISNLAIGTNSLINAIAIAAQVQDKNAVRGVIKHRGKLIPWSTLQQYEFHKGFDKS